MNTLAIDLDRPPLMIRLNEDLPEHNLRAGDHLVMDREPGWQDDGLYGMYCKSGDDWVFIGLDRVKVRTKTGALRKRIVLCQWSCRHDEEFRTLRPHKVIATHRRH